MSNYTVEGVTGTREFESKNGPLISYKLTIKGDDGYQGPAEIAQKPATPAPTPGQSIEGTLDKSNPKFPPKLKKAMGAGGGGRPPMGKSKADQDSIERAVAYKGAVDLVAAQLSAGGIQSGTAQIESAVTHLFDFSLTLLQGKPATPQAPAPAAPTAPDPGPTKQELTAGYHAYLNGATAIGLSQEAATMNIQLKKTALGIDSVEAATPEQKREILNFFNSI